MHALTSSTFVAEHASLLNHPSKSLYLIYFTTTMVNDSNDERNDERLEESHCRSPSQSKLDALIAAVNIAASEGSRADGNTAKNLRRQGGGFNGFSLYRRHAKQNGLKYTNSRFKQEWSHLPYEVREQYNRLARALKNNAQVAHCAVLPVGKQGWWAQLLYGV